MSDNLALESSLKTRSFAFLSEISFTNETGRSQLHVKKGLQECLFIDFMVSPELDDPEPADSRRYPN
jgi:hypothetical protein